MIVNSRKYETHNTEHLKAKSRGRNITSINLWKLVPRTRQGDPEGWVGHKEGEFALAHRARGVTYKVN